MGGKIMKTQTELTRGFGAQFPKNLIANMLYFIINVIIGILIVPYFISTLGVAAYGLIPLATSITGYVGIIVQALNSAVSRYLTVDLQKEDYVAANKTFSTSVFGLSAIIAFMIPLIVILSYFAPVIFNVPAGLGNDVFILFLCVCFTVLIRSWNGNFTVQLFAYNRLDYQNIVSIVNIIVQTGLILAFFTLYGPNLAAVGIAYVSGAISASLVAIVLAKKVCPHLKISAHSFDIAQLKAIGSMSWWVIIDQTGTLLFLQIDLTIVNLLFGAQPAGEYALVLMWVMLIWGVTNAIAGVLSPMIYTYYAKAQVETLTKMLVTSIKFLGLFLALSVGLICGFAPQILTLWVGDEFTFLSPLMTLLLLPLVINCAILPLFAVNIAYNRVRVPGIVTFFMGVGNIVLAVGLPLLTGWGYYGVAAAIAIMLTLRHAIFVPWYASRVLGVRASIFIQSILPGIVAALILAAGSAIIGNYIPITSMFSLVIIGGSISMIYLVMVVKFTLSPFERGLILTYLPKNMRKLVRLPDHIPQPVSP